MTKFQKALTLFITFFKIGAFTFGGGYAMIPLISREVVEKHKWITDEDILDIIAIAESTPGPIAINSATFVGYKICGVLGSLAATLGVVLPSFILILIISRLLDAFSALKAVQYAFFGIRAGVLALVLKALITMYKKCHKNIAAYIVMAAAFILSAALNVNIFFVIIGCAVFGLVSFNILSRRTEK